MDVIRHSSVHPALMVLAQYDSLNVAIAMTMNQNTAASCRIFTLHHKEGHDLIHSYEYHEYL